MEGQTEAAGDDIVHMILIGGIDAERACDLLHFPPNALLEASADSSG